VLKPQLTNSFPFLELGSVALSQNTEPAFFLPMADGRYFSTNLGVGSMGHQSDTFSDSLRMNVANMA